MLNRLPILALLTLSLCSAVLSADAETCAQQCADQAVALACYDDGKIYDNQCLADCLSEKSPALYQYYTCASLPEGVDCAAQCDKDDKLFDCLADPNNTIYTGQVYCFDTGIASSNINKARCYDPKAQTALFSCTSINQQYGCCTKCANYVAALAASQCAGAPVEWVCARDGVLYPNECTVTAANKTIVSPAGGNTAEDQAACVKAATQAVGSSFSSYANVYSYAGRKAN